MRIAFLGNHTVGVRTLEAIAEKDTVAAVVAHPPDPEDGVRYESVYDFAVERGWPVLRATGKSPELRSFLSAAQPDLLWVTDYRYLLPSDILTVAPLGAVNLHPSLLPKYRGRASINWAILRGEREMGLTAHFIDGGMDTGDLIEQVRIELNLDQDIGDALNLYYPIYQVITKKVLDQFRVGVVNRRKQDHTLASEFGRRKPEDGRIDWSRPAPEVLNLIRAVAHPYPGAFTYLGPAKVTIWKAALETISRSAKAGEVLTYDGGDNFTVACGEGGLRLKSWTTEGLFDANSLHVGAVFSSSSSEDEPSRSALSNS
jgi:methionyl-tRNA formyltransferase